MESLISAAQKVATRHGLEPDRCDILQDAHTIMERLTKSLVARIVIDTDGPRQGTT